MSDKKDNNQRSPIPSSARDLTMKSSDLLRRGLKLADTILSRFDVTPLNLSYEGDDGLAIIIFKRNTVIPARKTLIFSTIEDDQREIKIHFLQGMRPFASDNKTLCHVIVTGIPPAPRGVAKIEVTLDIDATGILHISIKDKATGRNLKCSIKTSSGLSENEIKKLLREAQKHAEEDRKYLAEAIKKRPNM